MIGLNSVFSALLPLPWHVTALANPHSITYCPRPSIAPPSPTRKRLLIGRVSDLAGTMVVILPVVEIPPIVALLEASGNDIAGGCVNELAY